MEPVVQGTHNETAAFLDFLFEGLEGLIYIAAKDPTLPKGEPGSWTQGYYQYPNQVSEITALAEKLTHKYELYVSPSLLTEKNANKKYFKVSQVVWVDFDGNSPDWSDSKGKPSLVIQSSYENNQHAYWKLTKPVTDKDILEDINRRLAYNMGADKSGWDAVQVLRLPGTYNHKYGDPILVHACAENNIEYDIEVFGSIAPPPEYDNQYEEWNVTSLPDVQDLILKHSFPSDMIHLLKKDRNQINDRSNALMQLGYGCAEMGMTDNEIFAMLLFMDDRIEKFKGRADRNKRLAHIVSVARTKYPLSQQESEEDEAFTFAFDYQSFLDTEINVDWIIEGMLMDRGSMLVVGPSGIGKTQISVQFMIHLALGRDYLHYHITKPQKIVFLSLEMDHGSLKQFLLKMNEDLTPEDRALLAENFVIVPHGEPWPLNTPEGQAHLTNILEELKPNGLFIDSIGSSIKGAISDDNAVMPYLAYIDRIRKKYECFVWAIHHMRKSQPGHNGAITQDDVYGNQYLLNRSSSTYGILRGKNGLIKIRNFKNRLAPLENDYHVQRTEHLNFTVYDVSKGLPPVGPLNIIIDTDNEPPSDTAPNGFSL